MIKKIIALILVVSISFASMYYFKGFRFYTAGLNLLHQGNIKQAQIDFKIALKNFQKAYSQNPDGINVNYMLGKMYLNGWGTSPNPNKAYKYLLYAYKNGADKAACELIFAEKELGASQLKILKLLNTIMNNKLIFSYCKTNYPKKINLLK